MENDRTSESRAVEAHHYKSWGWLLAGGIALALLGIIALGASVFTTFMTVTLLGWVLIGGGIVAVISAFTARGVGGFALHLLSGILLGIAGFMFLANPGVAARALTLMLALILLAIGIARVIDAFAERFPGWGWSVFAGGVAILLGAFVFAEYPTSAIWFLGLVVGVELLFHGVMWMAMAFELRRFEHVVEARRRPPPGMPHAQPGTA